MADITIDDFTAEARAFLDANAVRKPPAQEFVWGQGSDEVAVFDEKDRDAEAREAEEAKEWRRQRFDHGFGWITGPEKFGGRGLPAAYERAYSAVEANYDTPGMGIFTISLGMVAPTILAHAIPEVQDALPARPLPRRSGGLPAVLRARRRLRPGLHADQGDARRRRVDPERPEGVDVERAASPTSARSSAGPIPSCPSTRA